MTSSDNPYSGSFGSTDGQLSGEVSFQIGEQAPASAADGLIKDTNTANFMADVIQESRNQPVLVDFWAPWCGPCKQLTPMLEKAVNAAAGRVKLVKLNIDDHPAIPGQMGVQSIPAVIAFANGQPVDGFMGAVPESQINAFIDRIAGPAGQDEKEQIAAVLDQAQQRLQESDTETATQMFTAVLQHDADNLTAKAGLAECMIAAGSRDEALAILDALSDADKQDPAIARILARLALEEEAGKLGDPAALEARIAADPKDFDARLDLAKILSIRGEREKATDELIAIMKADRQWRDDGARRELLGFFEAWGPTDPATLAGRRKLSSILFS